MSAGRRNTRLTFASTAIAVGSAICLPLLIGCTTTRTPAPGFSDVPNRQKFEELERRVSALEAELALIRSTPDDRMLESETGVRVACPEVDTD